MTDYQSFTIISTPREERAKLGVGDIYSNEAKCLMCNDVIRSKNRHDFVTCKCGNLSVDGGSWYARRAYSTNQWEDMTVYFNDRDIEYDS